MIRVGVIGAGRIAADAHIPAILCSPGAELAGICTREPARHLDLQERYGCLWPGDASSFIRDLPADLIVICAPAGLHASLIRLCAAAGKHVLVEKPIGTGLPESLAAVEACRRAGVVLGVCYQRRLSPAFLRLRELLRNGTLGTLVSATLECTWHRAPSYYRSGKGSWEVDGGGALINQGIHSLDQLHCLLGPAEAVVCEARRRLHSLEAEDSAFGLLRMPGGPVATFSCTTAAAVSEDYKVVLVGTGAIATLTGGCLRVAAAGETSGIGDSAGGDAPPPLSLQELVRLQLERMLRAISGDGTPTCTGEEALLSLATVRAAYESARRGGWVTIEPV